MLRDRILAAIAAHPGSSAYEIVMACLDAAPYPHHIEACLRQLREEGVVVRSKGGRYYAQAAAKERQQEGGRNSGNRVPPKTAGLGEARDQLATMFDVGSSAPAPRYEPSGFIAPIPRMRLMSRR